MKDERNTVFQVIDNNGNVIYYHKYLCKCEKWVRKHYTFSELSGRGSWTTIGEKVTPQCKAFDLCSKYFPEFKSKNSRLFRRYVFQYICTPASPEAITECKCVAYIINSFH